MTIIGPALAAVAAVAVFNLLLSVGYVRRLREVHRAMTDWSARVANAPMMGGPVIGAPVPDFSVTTLDGATITATTLRGKRWAVGLFGATCGSCRTYLPQMCDLLAGGNTNMDAALVVIDGEREHAADLVASVKGRVPILLESTPVLSQALNLQVYPTFLLIDEMGLVAFGTNSIDDFRRRVAA